MTDNAIEARGVIAGPPVLSHLTHGKQFLSFVLACTRLSGATDELPVVAAETLGIPPAGDRALIRGQLRSYNNKSGTGAKLVVFLYAQEIIPLDAAESEHPVAHDNRATLKGTLCKAPILRRTPFGREICDLLLCVPRSYGRADYLPCIAWGQTARHLALSSPGDHVHIEGRLQSRRYTKTYEDGHGEEKTAFEVSVSEAFPHP